ncbi:MAG: FAD-dependent oxidoreductase [Acidobacteria bacterium]|nr:FAD-dependent oxidoreductase [Acidobacteriota bacterium]
MDTAIIGGGIIGASIAWRLLREGLRPVLFDAGTLGREASWAGAGMLVPGTEFSTPTPLASLAVRSLAMYPGFVSTLERDSGRTIDFSLCGSIEMAADAREADAFEERIRLQRDIGIEAHLRKSQGPWHAELHYPRDGQVDPRDIIAAIRTVFERDSPYALRERAAVQSIEPHRDHVLVHTAHGPFRARTAVLAAGAWSTDIPILGPALAVEPAFPVKGHLASWTFPAGALGPIRRRGHHYLLQRRSGTVVAGATQEHAGFDRTVHAHAVEEIARECALLWPELGASPPEHSWVGFRPATASGHPEIRRVGATPLWLAYGHFRNGILLAPATAESVAGEIVAAIK